jgi:hypothetical protein
MRDVPFHGEVSSSDASALTESASRILLYPAGSTTAYTLQATDQVVITELVAVAGAALTVTVFDGSDSVAGAGEIIMQGDFGVNGGVSEESAFTPHRCQLGTWPKVKTSGAGTIKVNVRGTIRNFSQTAQT